MTKICSASLFSHINLRLSPIIILSIFLTGCSLLKNSNDPYASFNPPKIHVSNKDKSLKEPIQSENVNIQTAEKLVFDKYYDALIAASGVEANINASTFPNDAEYKLSLNSQKIIYNYLDAGIALSNSVCLRWFQSLSDLQSKLDLSSAETNVISELGTTLLGIGKASSYIVGSYGALNSARMGMERNFSQIFLLAPNASKIKQHVLQGMKAYESSLRSESSKLTFLQAYSALEKYADICTHETAKGIIETALSDTETSSDKDGNITNKINPVKANAEKSAGEQAAVEAKRIAAEKMQADLKQAQDDFKQLQALTKAQQERAKLDIEKAQNETKIAQEKAAKAEADAKTAKAEAITAKSVAEKSETEANKQK